MPQHDPTDGKDVTGNVVDFRAHLRRRAGPVVQDVDERGPDAPDWEVFARAEYGDGKPPKFNRYDLLWLGMIVVIAAIFWKVLRF